MDLFPSDFIIQLEAPDNYFGANKIFNSYYERKKYEKLSYKRPIRILDTEEEYFLPIDHKKDYPYTNLPNSLKEAILSFLLNCCIRTINGYSTKHRSMMINITRFNDVQLEIKTVVLNYVESLRRIISQTSLYPLKKFLRDDDMNHLYLIYNSEFYQNYEEDDNKKLPEWAKIQSTLYDEINKFEVAIFNNKIKYDDRFDYEKYKDVGARVIAIGGFVLSRGLTLEGLMVSYFSRATNAYDTALQMCRWFGYRNHYQNLCRVYMTQDNVDNFGAVIDSVENLKLQFKDMAIKDKTPRDYGLMIQESPDSLNTRILVTAQNKQYHSKKIEKILNYGGVSADTSKIYSDFNRNNINASALNRFIEKLKFNNLFMSDEKPYIIKDVPKDYIADFLKELVIHYENRKFDVDNLVSYIKDDKLFDKWNISVVEGSSKTDWHLAGKNIHPARRSFVVKKEDKDFIRIAGSNNRLINPGDFAAGLSDDQLEKVKQAAKERLLNDTTGKIKTDTPITKDYLSQHENPMLIIYPIVLKCTKDNAENPDDIDPAKKAIWDSLSGNGAVLGFGIGFPNKEDGVKVTYRANQRKIEEMTKVNDYDLDEDEEDDDDDN